jgi:hypothetical protein
VKALRRIYGRAQDRLRLRMWQAYRAASQPYGDTRAGMERFTRERAGRLVAWFVRGES